MGSFTFFLAIFGGVLTAVLVEAVTRNFTHNEALRKHRELYDRRHVRKHMEVLLDRFRELHREFQDHNGKYPENDSEILFDRSQWEQLLEDKTVIEMMSKLDIAPYSMDGFFDAMDIRQQGYIDVCS